MSTATKSQPATPEIAAAVLGNLLREPSLDLDVADDEAIDPNACAWCGDKVEVRQSDGELQLCKDCGFEAQTPQRKQRAPR